MAGALGPSLVMDGERTGWDDRSAASGTARTPMYHSALARWVPRSPALLYLMVKPIQFTLTPEQMTHFLTWQARVKADAGRPLTGVVFSFLVGNQGEQQLIVRPSTEQDFKLPNTPRADGTADTFAPAPHEEVLAVYDDFGFAATTILWRNVGMRLWLCEGNMVGRGEVPRCYVECLDETHRPFIPFRISDRPGVLDEDLLCTVFPLTPLPPALSDRIEAFIRTNVTALLQHWRGETDSRDLLDALQPPGLVG